MVTLVICSPIPALRAGLRALLTADPDISVAAVVPDLSALPELPPDVRVLVVTPGGIGLGEFPPPESGEVHPDLAVLLISDDIDEAQALGGLELRAWGVLSPEAPAEALQAAVRALAEGLVVASPEMFERLLAQPDPLPAADAQEERQVDRLTSREIEVLRCLSEGLTNKQIALALHISEHTVKFHVSSIYAKLAVANRTEAVRIGARRGLVPL